MHVRIRNGARWHRLWRRGSVQFCVQKSFSLLRVLIIGIELESFVHIGHGGLQVALRLINEGAHLIIFRFLRAELDRFVVIVQRFISNLPAQFPVANGEVRLRGALVEIDETTGRALRISRIDEAAAVSSGESQSEATLENEYKNEQENG